MKRMSILNKKTALRNRKLGDLGENLAAGYLERAGFSEILNLNEHKKNYPYADIVATRDGVTFVLSVKTRNKYETRSGNLNARYKLGKNCYKMADAAAANQNATPAWLAIQIDREHASVYFGTLTQLEGNSGIPMTPDVIDQYECIANNEPHGLDLKHLENTYELRQPYPTKPQNF